MPYLGGGVVPYGFVGQSGFFENFIVKFDLSTKSVELTAVDK